MANYTLNQGETWRVTLELQDSSCNPIRLATEENGVYTATVFFAGVAKQVGANSVDILFRMQPKETKTYGRGALRTTEEGVFKVYAYIPADATAEMAAGDWTYEIRQSDVSAPDLVNAPHAVATVLEGIITINDGPLDTGTTFTYGSPSAP